MADAFSNLDTKRLLNAKHIMCLGDSNTRALYKDLIWLLNSNTLINRKSLQRKLELSFLGDNLVNRSRLLHHGRDFQEVRRYMDRNTQTVVEFMFITRCFNKQIEMLFGDFKQGSRPVPDIIVMNSCVWDLTRWGPNGVPAYKDNMVKLMRLMTHSLPQECLVIWTTTLPTAPHICGGLIIKQIEFVQPLLRFEAMEANTFARQVVASHGFDVLDNHYHMRMQIHRRTKDGLHYLPTAVRLMTNLLLTHIALSWGCDLPGNISSMLLDKAKALHSKPVLEPSAGKIPTGGIFARINIPSPVVPRTKGLKITFNTDTFPMRRCKLAEDQLPDYQEDYSFQQLNHPQHEYAPIEYPQFGPSTSSSSYYQGVPHMYHSEANTNYVGPTRRRGKRNKNKRNEPYHDNRYYYH